MHEIRNTVASKVNQSGPWRPKNIQPPWDASTRPEASQRPRWPVLKLFEFLRICLHRDHPGCLELHVPFLCDDLNGIVNQLFEPEKCVHGACLIGHGRDDVGESIRQT
jgi:hypothetical protein